MDPSIRPSFIEANGVTLHCAEAGPANGPLSSFCTAFPNSGSRGANIFSHWRRALPAEPA